MLAEVLARTNFPTPTRRRLTRTAARGSADPRHLRDRLARLPDQPHRALPKS